RAFLDFVRGLDPQGFDSPETRAFHSQGAGGGRGAFGDGAANHIEELRAEIRDLKEAWLKAHGDSTDRLESAALAPTDLTTGSTERLAKAGRGHALEALGSREGQESIDSWQTREQQKA